MDIGNWVRCSKIQHLKIRREEKKERNSESGDPERSYQVCVPILPTSDSVKWKYLFFGVLDVSNRNDYFNITGLSWTVTWRNTESTSPFLSAWLQRLCK